MPENWFAENLGAGEWWTVPAALSAPYRNDDLQGALMAITNLMCIVAPIYLMCAPRDIKVLYQVKAPETDLPTIFLYDQYPGGVGLSEKAYEMQELLLEHALNVLEGCSCENGCPSCVGPESEIGSHGKEYARRILKELIDPCQA